MAWARKLALRRLAQGVLPELDACFAALGMDKARARAMQPAQDHRL